MRSGWMRAAAIAGAAGIPVSTHLYPEVAAQVMRVTETAHWLEWQDWADPILQRPYEIKDGLLHIPDVPGVGGRTTLHHLATATVGDEHRITRATLLLDAGASLSKRDHLLKSTPLGWACRWGRVDLVRLYLSRGADPREPDAETWATPLAWARKGGHGEIVELLDAHGAE